MRPHRSENVRGKAVEDLVEAADGARIGGDGVEAEAEGHQIEAPVAAPGAVPVDDAGDAPAVGQQVGGLIVVVDRIIADEVAGVAGSDGGDPAVKRPGAGTVLAQRLMQAVAGAVAGEVKPDRRNGAVAGELASLEVVEGECLLQQGGGETADRGAGKQLPDEGDRVPGLDGQFGRGGEVPG
jgi:hypothetical protein